jgi:septal ring factor EnvC (AmiA/AmiB activator)
MNLDRRATHANNHHSQGFSSRNAAGPHVSLSNQYQYANMYTNQAGHVPSNSENISLLQPPSQADSMRLDGIQATCDKLETMLEDLKKENEDLRSRVHDLEEIVQETRDKVETQPKTKSRTKNVSNQHPVVKVRRITVSVFLADFCAGARAFDVLGSSQR